MFAGMVSAQAADISTIVPADRLMHWSTAGIPGGIPNRTTVCATLAANATVAQINSAISSCSNGVVMLGAGTYTLSGSIQLNKNGVTLRGVGRDQTILRRGSSMVIMGNRESDGSPGSITGSANRGSTQITAANASGLAVGDFIVIRQNNPSYVTAQGSSGLCNWCAADEAAQAMAQIDKITTISGSTLTLEHPLYIDYANAPHCKKLSNMTSSVGVEDLTVESTAGGKGGGNIEMHGCAYCWIKNVASIKAQKAHFWVDTAYASEIRENIIKDGWAFNADHAYGLRMNNWNSANRIEDNIFERLRHSLVFEGGGSGNVLAYNYLKDPNTDDSSFLGEEMSYHGSHPFMNLWEGNIGTTIAPDNTWGSSSHSLYFRNFASGKRTTSSHWGWVISVESNSMFHSFVGNVLGYSGIASMNHWVYEKSGCSGTSGYAIWRWGCKDVVGGPANAAVRPSTITHGNYDYKRNQFDWTAGKPQDLPASLLYSSKPAYFGSLAWPPLGPDPVNPSSVLTGTIPAKVRFEGGSVRATPTPTPTPPASASPTPNPNPDTTPLPSPLSPQR